ncbi:MAG: hypothetical protein L3J07_04045 [Candidatus Magasanikbacteria bacterium]|nr:hypothetical protein [Candidatus Magasanikbacteria bacterium]
MNEEIQTEINQSYNNPKNIWILVLSILLTALIVGIGMYFLQQLSTKNTEKAFQTQIQELQTQIKELNKNKEDVGVIPEVAETSKTLNVIKKDVLETKYLAINTSNWKVYTNDSYGFSFSYPEGFAIVKDAVKVIYSGNSSAKNWYQITLIDISGTENTYFNIDINPDGYGPFFYDKTYDLSMNSTGKIVVNSIEKILVNEQNTDGKIQIGSNVVKDFNSQEYMFRFGFDEGGKDMEPILKGILNSLLFTK